MLVPTLGRRFALGMSKAAAVRWAIAGIAALVLPNPCLGLYSRTSAVTEAYAAAVLISLVVYRLDLRGFKCLDGGALRLLGLSSGSYYVLHTATPPLAIALAQVMIPPAWSANVPGVIGFIVIPAWLVFIAPLMWCSYHLIEAPGIALGRRVVRACRLDAPSVSSPGEQRRAARRAA
jgi:peptidoglycan/LPS O-acetylase OafA/YrhL